MESKRNVIHSLYLLKFFLAVLIVCIHMQVFFSPDVKAVIIPLTRIGVPLFFIINAYLKRQLLKITKVTSVAIVIYLVYSFLKGEMTISSLVSIKRWGLLFLFNVSTVGVHLWYLLAYIYVLLIVYFVKKSQISDFQIFIMGGVILCLTPIIALLCSFGGIPVVLYSNWLFTGIPFFVLGMYI